MGHGYDRALHTSAHGGLSSVTLTEQGRKCDFGSLDG